MNSDWNHWLGKLANPNVARTEPRGIAPHKPLMLLTVIDLIESGDIPDGWVGLDYRELIERVLAGGCPDEDRRRKKFVFLYRAWWTSSGMHSEHRAEAAGDLLVVKGNHVIGIRTRLQVATEHAIRHASNEPRFHIRSSGKAAGTAVAD